LPENTVYPFSLNDGWQLHADEIAGYPVQTQVNVQAQPLYGQLL
jgi:hypothetical protein